MLHWLAASPHNIITEVIVAAINTPRRQIKKCTAAPSSTHCGIHTEENWQRTSRLRRGCLWRWRFRGCSCTQSCLYRWQWHTRLGAAFISSERVKEIFSLTTSPAKGKFSNDATRGLRLGFSLECYICLNWWPLWLLMCAWRKSTLTYPCLLKAKHILFICPFVCHL